jgi:hypothetical protein
MVIAARFETAVGTPPLASRMGPAGIWGQHGWSSLARAICNGGKGLSGREGVQQLWCFGGSTIHGHFFRRSPVVFRGGFLPSTSHLAWEESGFFSALSPGFLHCERALLSDLDMWTSRLFPLLLFTVFGSVYWQDGVAAESCQLDWPLY